MIPPKAELEWAEIQARLETNPEKLWSLQEMERTGDEPEMVGFDKKSGEYIFYDCSTESPKFHRSLCYDREALEESKEPKPVKTPFKMRKPGGALFL